MTTEHDFQSALKAFNALDGMGKSLDIPRLFQDQAETIRFALRLADKLLGQEPSEGMMVRAWVSDGLRNGAARSAFKSMLAAAVTELEQQK